DFRAQRAGRGLAAHPPVLPSVAVPNLTARLDNHMTTTRGGETMLERIHKQGRRLLTAAGLALAVAIGGTAAAQGESKEPIVFGGSIPLTGVFAFAGIHIHAGLSAYVDWINSPGGINGRPVQYVMEDTGYLVDRSVATYKKLSGRHRICCYYGDSTGFMQAIAADLNNAKNMIMSGASFATALTRVDKHPFQF